jgi:glutathione S-transferase
MAMLLYADSKFTSPYVMSVFVALTEKKLPFKIQTVDLDAGANNDPDYALISLTQRVPSDRQQRARARQVQAWLRSDFLPIRVERPTPTIFYQQPATTPLSAAAQTAARKLCAGASELLSHGGDNLCRGWSIADVDLALMLNRLIMNGDQVPLPLVRYAGAQWERPSVQNWVRRDRPPL